MHALGRLIVDVMATQGWNQAELGRRAGISRSRVGQLINDPIKAVPGKPTIITLARGLGLPPWVVMDAILETMGLPTHPSHVDIDDAVAADVTLDAASKRATLALVEQLRQRSGRPVTELRPPQPDLTDQRIAARRGKSVGRRLRKEQDEDTETP